MADLNTKSGVWLDTKTRKVVTSEPEEGMVLAAPGDELTDELRATVDRLSLPVSDPIETATAVPAEVSAKRATAKR